MMMTLIVVFAAVALVVIAGEAVRGQCRRMLDRPVPLVSAADVPVDVPHTPAPVSAVAA
jgi:hypothetical protein